MFSFKLSSTISAWYERRRNGGSFDPTATLTASSAKSFEDAMTRDYRPDMSGLCTERRGGSLGWCCKANQIVLTELGQRNIRQGQERLARRKQISHGK